jgi:hypothetical protein
MMKREPDESFEDYKARRKIINRRIKETMRGRLVWDATRHTGVEKYKNTYRKEQ